MASPIFATVGSIIVSFHLSVYFCLFLKCVPTEDICLISSTIWFRLSALLIYNDLVLMHHCTWTCWVVNVQFLLLSPDNSKKLKKPKPWKHNQAITTTQLKQMRDEFWDTAPHYGGQKEIWDALRAAAEAELSLAQTIVDSAGIIVSNSDMTICYDERGAKYELPKYVLSEPTNLIREG